MQCRKTTLLIFSIFLILLISGCATVNNKHPMVVSTDVKAGDPENYAHVYFIRPKPYKPKGIADDPIRVEFQGKILLTIDEGSYTLLRIKPSSGQLKVFNQTKFINRKLPVEVWRAREYKFIEGKTYFIHLKRTNEEFRGIFYEPEPIKFAIAKELADTIRASGEARNAPIEKLKDISEPPVSAIENSRPALPENIYKREVYLK